MINCTRRNFLIGSLSSVFFSGMSFPLASNYKKNKYLIIIYLRGGMDGLSEVPVLGDKNLIKQRKELI